MNITRFLHVSTLVLGAATVACTDAPAPPLSAPAAGVSPVLQAAHDSPADRIAAMRTTGTAVAGSRRELPAEYRWVGEEHNRLLDLINRDFAEARKRGLVPKSDPSRDCRRMWARVKGEAVGTARRGGFAGHEREVVEAAEPAVLRMPLCLGPGGSALSPSAVPNSGGRGAGRVEISEAAFRVLETARGSLAAASTMEDVDAAIVAAASAATSLNSADAAAVYAALSVARYSADYWASVMPGPQQWSLFRSDWDDFVEIVGADFGGCVGTLGFFRMFSAAMPVNFKIGVCALGGAVSSGMRYAEMVYAQ